MVFYENVFRALFKRQVRYLVVGGVAINLYGILRTTADLDLMVDLENGKNAGDFLDIMKELGYRPRVPVPPEYFKDPAKRMSWQIEKGALVFTFVLPNSYDQVDVFLKEPIPFRQAYQRRRSIGIANYEISVASLRDLKTLKEQAGRDKDRSDLLHLNKLEDLQHGS